MARTLNDDPAVVLALIKAGTDPNARTGNGMAVSWVAEENRNPAVAMALLKARAAPTARDEGVKISFRSLPCSRD